jgi:hypothetical protein
VNKLAACLQGALIPRKLSMSSADKFRFFPFFLVFYEFTTYIANDMIMPGMGDVVADFSSSNDFIPWSLTAYMLGGASLQPHLRSFRSKNCHAFGKFYFSAFHHLDFFCIDHDRIYLGPIFSRDGALLYRRDWLRCFARNV